MSDEKKITAADVIADLCDDPSIAEEVKERISNETMRSIAEEIRQLSDSTPDGIIAICGSFIANRIEAVCRRAYNEIDSAVCSIDSISSTDIDYIRKMMDETIGDCYE